jgi:hypothetical protein
MLIWDEQYLVDYPVYRCPECKSGFFGGGKALHKKGCSIQGYAGCEQVVGPKVLEMAQNSREGRHPLCDLTVDELEAAKLKRRQPADRRRHGPLRP